MLGRLFYYLVVISLQPLSLILQKLCGLPINTYFSAVKLRWLIDHCEAVRKAIDEERCLFGTVDSWLIWVNSFYMLFHRIFNTQDWSFSHALLLSPSSIHLQNPSQVFTHNVYVVVQNFSWFKYYCLLFHYDTLSYSKTKENKIWTKDKIEPQCICYRSNYIQVKIF